jgi:hypothetical protein
MAGIGLVSWLGILRFDGYLHKKRYSDLGRQFISWLSGNGNDMGQSFLLKGKALFPIRQGRKPSGYICMAVYDVMILFYRWVGWSIGFETISASAPWLEAYLLTE